jgi:hypothetical protein
MFLRLYLAYPISISNDLYFISIIFNVMNGFLFITSLHINVIKAVGI